MSSNWESVQDILMAAIEEEPSKRRAFVEEACKGDATLISEVMSLLERHETGGEILDAPLDFGFKQTRNLEGTRVGHYEVIEKLDGGGMGVVFKARDTKLDRMVALKFLLPHLLGSPDAKKRFIREAKAASSLDHPNICTVYEIGEGPSNGVYIAMSYYDGETLAEMISRGPIEPAKALNFASQIADGLARAHEAGIIHRDVKPANIFVTKRGRVKILDFGIAKIAGMDSTVTTGTLGTPSYMSPEQLEGEPLDLRTDLWSLGVVLFEMLTGQRPFSGESNQTVAYAILNKEPEYVSDVNEAVPDSASSVVKRLLRKDPGARFQTAADVVHALVADGDSTSGTSRKRERDRTGTRRWMAVAGTVAVIGGLAVGSYFVLDQDVTPAGARAEPKLAVLPFSNMRSDPETDYLGYALADRVISSLVYAQNLTVRSSSAVRKYRDGDYDLAEVKDDLAVNFLLAGSYLWQDDRMRLTVELVDLETRETVWSEPIEVSYQDAFEMQDLVAERLLRRLEVSFTPDERARMTADVSQDPLAYEYYLRSLSYSDEPEGNQLAVNMLHQSIALDSTFAPAWDALGRREQLRAYWELGGKQVLNRAEGFFLEALELNPELFTALAHLTMLYTDSGETDLAMETALRTLEINPNSAEGMFAYGYVLRYAGMLTESVTAMTRALEIDPTNPTFRSAGYTFVQNGQYDDAIEAFRLGSPGLALAWEAEIAIRQDRPEEGRAKFSQVVAADPGGIVGLWAIGMLAALDGDYSRGVEAARKWEDANLIDGEGWYYLAGLYCLNGENDKCISALDTAVDRGYFEYPYMLRSRFLDPARGNPEFDAVLEKARVKHEAFKTKFF